jgi:malonyl-CoA/methylmalonyl-CoA synthetase
MSNHLYDRIAAGIEACTGALLETIDGHSLSGQEVVEKAAVFADVLRASGAGAGDRIAVQVEKSPEALSLYLACLRVGAIFLPLNTAYTLAELSYFLGDAEPRLMICQPHVEGDVTGLAGKLGRCFTLSLGERAEGTLMALARLAKPDHRVEPRGPDDIAAILYTSGTTGRSKGAMLSHANLASNAAALVEAWRFAPNDILIHALPIFHTHGLFVATNVALLSGAAMLFVPKFDAAYVLSLFARATVLMGVPTFYTRLLGLPGLTRAATQHMRLFVSGSAPLLEETHREFLARTGHAILERYGMTETSIIASNPYQGERRAGTVGLPLPGVDLRIVDPASGLALAPGHIGMIEIKGPNVFKGYWRQPEKTAAEFRSDGYFMTGDLGRFDAGDYVQIVGRGKDLIISGGFNVYPKEIEAEIDAIVGVAESAVIGVPHPDFGEGVTAIVVGRSALDEAAVLAALQPRLARYKLPKRVFFVEELPRNTMGKVQKNVLRETYATIYAALAR